MSEEKSRAKEFKAWMLKIRGSLVIASRGGYHGIYENGSENGTRTIDLDEKIKEMSVHKLLGIVYILKR